MLQVEHLQKTYRKYGKKVGLLDASFAIPNGQIVGVMGENGAGKTTLLRTLAGLLPASGGTALFDGTVAKKCIAKISYITGEGSYYPCFTVGEYGRFLEDLHPSFDFDRYRKFAAFFSLALTDAIYKLSTGQRARVELAAGFAKKANYYLMDEPFLGKDVFTRRDFLKLMSGTLHGGETILLCTHYVDEVEYFLDRALILQDGVIADDVDMETLHNSGDTLLERMAKACGYDPNRYLSFEQDASL